LSHGRAEAAARAMEKLVDDARQEAVRHLQAHAAV
jgi:hypothetical protein